MRQFFSIIAVLAIFLSGCSGKEGVVLRQADAIMEERPDSAMSLLRGVKRSELGSRDLPYYALLMTQAQVKTDVPLDSDSLISIAYRKYSDDWFGDKGIRSNFYMGEIFFNQQNSREAIKYYLTAYEESKRLNNDYWIAKSAERIADLFFIAYNYGEAASYRKEAIEYFRRSKRISNQRFAITDLSIDLMNDSKFDEAIFLIDSVYNIVLNDHPIDSVLLEYIESPKAEMSEVLACGFQLDSINVIDDSKEEIVHLLYSRYRNARTSGQVNQALEMVDSILYLQDAIAKDIIKESVIGAERDYYNEKSVKNNKRSVIFLICFLTTSIATLFIWRISQLRNKATRIELENNIESFIELKYHSDRIAVEKSNLEKSLKMKSDAIEVLRKTVDEGKRQVTILENKLTKNSQSTSVLLNNVEQKSNEVELLYKNLHEKALVIDELKNTVIHLQREVNEQRKNIFKLERDIDNQSNDIRGKDKIMETLFREQWKTLNTLCNEYYEKGESPNMRKHIIDSMEKELKKISTKKGLQQIETVVNARHNGVIELIRRECPFLSEKDVNMAMLIIAGFSGKAISYLMGIKTGNFYVSKRRLIDKISASTAPDRDLFIARLS